jgi:hypothetical protein
LRFGLRDREVEALMAGRGISLTYEAGRSWGQQFRHASANAWRRQRPDLGTNGIWSRGVARSTRPAIVSGGPSIKVGTASIGPRAV